ncbi:hypothetical protein MNAN1_003654 [Malassezia nana]|uniref:tRNA-splicing endonuclease subunit Sen15 domain-containing protein n=1 Tax=Malassezia nana TaxID=180528 RepID=A0AAF0J3X9_9BASI|nr:hypothetical protein MNAN1_003654 [Malassezia nana]
MMHGKPAAAPQAATHEAFAIVQSLCDTYPSQASALFQTYVDLRYAARWRDLQVRSIQRRVGATDAASEAANADFGANGWAIFVGVAPGSKDKQVVVPMVLEQAIDSAMLGNLFARLPEDAVHTHVLLAMMSNDATVVYYRLSQGMVKPIN